LRPWSENRTVVDLARRLLPGTFEHTVNHAIDRTGSGVAMDLGVEVQSAAGRNSAPASKAHALSDAGFYVPEIDGLRAVAVGAVMLYHLNFNASVMRGGFVGVDIFFVISGYVVAASLGRDAGRPAVGVTPDDHALSRPEQSSYDRRHIYHLQASYIT